MAARFPEICRNTPFHRGTGDPAMKLHTKKLGIQISLAMIQCEVHHIDCLEQDRSNSSAVAMELLQSYAKPSTYPILHVLNTYSSGFYHSQQRIDHTITQTLIKSRSRVVIRGAQCLCKSIRIIVQTNLSISLLCLIMHFSLFCTDELESPKVCWYHVTLCYMQATTKITKKQIKHDTTHKSFATKVELIPAT